MPERFDKYFASPSDGATIAREIHQRAVHSRRRLLYKFQSCQTCSSVLTLYESDCVQGFLKNGTRAVLVGDSILVFGGQIVQRVQRSIGCSVQ